MTAQTGQTPVNRATWHSQTPPPKTKIGPWGWVRVVVRGAPLAVLVFGGLVLHMAVRLVERPLCGLARPATPHITQAVCRGALALLGLRFALEGTPMRAPGAIVANHSSWLDIFALNARDRVYFISKSEVAVWPGIGWLARATGTVFVARDRGAAQVQLEVLQARLRAGHRLVLFPEGTSTDGRRVLPFKPTLFAAFLAPNLAENLCLQPVSVIYHAPGGADPRFYGWWGGMEFGPHLLAVLAQRPQGQVTVRYHPPVRANAAPDRKALAALTEAPVRNGLQAAGVLEP